MAAPLKPIENAIYNALAGDNDLTNALGGTAIYLHSVPAGVSPPYVVVTLARGGDMNLCPARVRLLRYNVRAISTTSMTEALNLDAYCDADLHGQELTVTGWTNIWISRDKDIVYREIGRDGVEYFHAGGEYRIIIAEV